MEKTKIGLSAGIVGAIVFLLFLFGGYTVGLLAFGYVMLCEKDESLRLSAVTAVLVALAASVITLVISLIPNLMGILNSLLSAFDADIDLSVLYNLESFLNGLVSLARAVALVGLAGMSALGKPLQLAAAKKLLGTVSE